VGTGPLIALSAATFLVLAGCAVDCSAVCQAGNPRAGCHLDPALQQPGWSLGIVAYPDSATQSWVRVTLTEDHAVKMP